MQLVFCQDELCLGFNICATIVGWDNPVVYAVWPQVINQVLHHIHLVGRHVVERDGAVTAAAHALGHRVEHVLLVPEVVRHVARYQVVLGHEREKPSSTQGISEREY